MLESHVIEALKTLKTATYEELRKHLIQEEVEFRDIELREVVVKLVKEGRVVRIPSSERAKFLLKLSDT